MTACYNLHISKNLLGICSVDVRAFAEENGVCSTRLRRERRRRDVNEGESESQGN